MTRFFKTAFLALVLAGTLSACDMVSGRESAGQYATDTAISARVKMGLSSDPVLAAKPFQINVETMQGVVLLSGFVDSTEIENRAVAVARKTDGVKDVRDAMQTPNAYNKR